MSPSNLEETTNGHQSGGGASRGSIQLSQRSSLDHGVFRGSSRSEGSRAAGFVWNVGSSRVVVEPSLQRMAHSGDHASHLRISQRAGDRRAAVYGHRHACLIGAGFRQRAGGTGCERGCHPDRASGRVHADAGDLARDSQIQSWKKVGVGRRHRHHAVAQSARGWRIQVQPAAWRPGGQRDYRSHPKARERTARKQPGRREENSAQRRASYVRTRRRTISSPSMSRIWAA